MRLQVSENYYRGIECMNWFVSLALNHLSFCPSHIHMATSVLASPVLVFRCKVHTAWLARGCSYRTLKAHLSLKPSDVYTESFTTRVMLLCFPFPGVYKVACPAAGRGTSTALRRNVQGRLAGRGRAVPHTFPGCQHGGVAF